MTTTVQPVDEQRFADVLRRILVGDLKQILKRLRLPHSGNKQPMIDRIVEHFRQQQTPISRIMLQVMREFVPDYQAPLTDVLMHIDWTVPLVTPAVATTPQLIEQINAVVNQVRKRKADRLLEAGAKQAAARAQIQRQAEINVQLHRQELEVQRARQIVQQQQQRQQAAVVQMQRAQQFQQQQRSNQSNLQYAQAQMQALASNGSLNQNASHDGANPYPNAFQNVHMHQHQQGLGGEEWSKPILTQQTFIPQFAFLMNPLYHLVRFVAPPDYIHKAAAGPHKRCGAVDPQVQKFLDTKDGLKYQLFVTCYRWSNMKLVHQARQADAFGLEFPATPSLYVNTQQVRDVQSITKSGYPINITQYVVGKPSKDGKLHCHLGWERSHDTYGFQLWVGFELTPDDIVQAFKRDLNLKASRTMSYNAVLAAMFNPEDADLISRSTLSLKDPYMLTPIQLAVRGRECTHLQCFDLACWIGLNTQRGININTERAGAWCCPVCNTYIGRAQVSVKNGVCVDYKDNLDREGQNIVYCEYVNSIIKKVQQEKRDLDDVIVNIEVDGKWSLQEMVKRKRSNDVSANVKQSQHKSSAPITLSSDDDDNDEPKVFSNNQVIDLTLSEDDENSQSRHSPEDSDESHDDERYDGIAQMF